MTAGTTGMGLALVGGIGHLARPHGLTIEQLINATLVLANGSVVRHLLLKSTLCLCLSVGVESG